MGVEVAERISKLEALGFKAAAKKIQEMKEKSRKMAIAYEHFRFVRPEKIARFNEKLLRKSMYLAFTEVGEYEKTPPDSVLHSMEVAVKKKCFDSFEVAHIEKVPDPILFGCIKGCADKFYIDQWDNDVTIEQILGPKEG